MIDVKGECAIDRSRVVVHIRPFNHLKTLYGSCFMLARKTLTINSERRKYILNFKSEKSGLAKHHQNIDDTKKSLIKIRPKNTVVTSLKLHCIP